jgi:hypothetical protein
MIEFETFTVNADVIEDRIRLDAVGMDGTGVSVMLTRRLCDRFLPLFVNAVEQSARPGLPREIELSMAQQQLRQAREEAPLPDVVLPEGASTWLCRTIHLESRDNGLVWTLTDDAANSAAMFLHADSPRGVLDVFYQMYQHLEWDEGVFPGWLRGDCPDGQTPRTLN